MSRQETDREDLMREATALVQRAEFAVPQEPNTVIAGYRRDGSLSIYFGADPCFHLDPQRRLRRAFIDGDLYRTQGHTLARLVRTRNGQTVVLRRHDLSPAELATLLNVVRDRLQAFDRSLSGDCRCLQTVPPQTDLRPRLVESLGAVTSIPLVLAPAVRGKR